MFTSSQIGYISSMPIGPLWLVNAHLVGGLEHVLFSNIFHIWDVILPIDELHHFSRWLKHVQNHQPIIHRIG